MKRNIASQHIACQMNSRSDGSPLTSSVAIAVTKDNGTSTAGGGTLTHKANGHWNYAPTQAETDAAHVVFQFTHSTGVNQVVQVYPSFPQSGDAYQELLDELVDAIAIEDIKSEVVDALSVDTYGEPGQGAPPATTSIQTKLAYLYKGWRNKSTQDRVTGDFALFADDTTTVDQKAATTDDGDLFTRGEMITGA